LVDYQGISVGAGFGIAHAISESAASIFKSKIRGHSHGHHKEIDQRKQHLCQDHPNQVSEVSGYSGGRAIDDEDRFQNL
jgi:hypothetical protein